ncbi:methyltransferase family protein [Anaerostipes sp.]|uniref:methyltransferase family protein n=1 Tax=Anaerostipes sp. TaxID=1872530 RepID=UPI0025C50586|nr:isoprenylcysteine carboxylmethyltransferase family protein [Anaerostipes sp.]MBS7008771.1 DUF1295 domain-containing protein [Anaerostipes sp.]
MKKGAIIYIIKLFIQRALGILLFLSGSEGYLGTCAAVYFGFYLTTTAISSAVMYHVNPETLSERSKTNTDSPVWDKILLAGFWLLAYFLIYYIAGTETIKHKELGIIFWAGIFLQVCSSILTVKAMIVNTYLESTARIQKDRGQTVCKEGPYQIVRHPAYSAILIWCAAAAMVFQAPMTAAAAFTTAVLIVIRTYLEDQMLRRGLEGYEIYTQEVKYRLIPFIW